jgi:hypothetical protein
MSLTIAFGNGLVEQASSLFLETGKMPVPPKILITDM